MVKEEETKNTKRSIHRSRQKAAANSTGSVHCDECELANSKHAGIRYPCIECPDRPSFTRKGDLKKHSDSIHPGVKYPYALSVTT